MLFGDIMFFPRLRLKKFIPELMRFADDLIEYTKMDDITSVVGFLERFIDFNRYGISDVKSYFVLASPKKYRREIDALEALSEAMSKCNLDKSVWTNSIKGCGVGPDDVIINHMTDKPGFESRPVSYFMSIKDDPRARTKDARKFKIYDLAFDKARTFMWIHANNINEAVKDLKAIGY
jgi:hypothetical protein